MLADWEIPALCLLLLMAALRCGRTLNLEGERFPTDYIPRLAIKKFRSRSKAVELQRGA